jgi:hypothetical protein
MSIKKWLMVARTIFWVFSPGNFHNTHVLDAIEEKLFDLEMEGECDDDHDDDKNMLFGGKGIADDEIDSDDSTLNLPIAKKVRVSPEDTVP